MYSNNDKCKPRNQKHGYYYLCAVCVTDPEHVRVLLGQEFRTGTAAYTELLVSKHSTVCGFHTLSDRNK